MYIVYIFQKVCCRTIIYKKSALFRNFNRSKSTIPKRSNYCHRQIAQTRIPSDTGDPSTSFLPSFAAALTWTSTYQFWKLKFTQIFKPEKMYNNNCSLFQLIISITIDIITYNVHHGRKHQHLQQGIHGGRTGNLWQFGPIVVQNPPPNPLTSIIKSEKGVFSQIYLWSS